MGFLNRFAFEHLLGFMRLKDVMAKSGNLPVLRQLADRVLLDSRSSSMSPIPIHADIELPPGVVAPRTIIEHFIEQSPVHALVRRCPCRTAMKCKDFDREFGCTFLGAGAAKIDERIARLVGRDEALEHLDRACEMGLVSVIGKFKGDALALGVRDHARLMTICHCCPCCCVTNSLHYAPREARDIVTRIEGLTVRVGDGCTGCGSCVDACVFKQISISDGTAVIGPECKGCGRCASACPAGSIRLRVEDSSYIDACIERISSRVDMS